MDNFISLIGTLTVFTITSTLFYLFFDVFKTIMYDTNDVQKVEVMNVWDMKN